MVTLYSLPGDLTHGPLDEESEPTDTMGTCPTRSVAFFALALMAPLDASAEPLTIWVRDNGATLATRVIDHWNETHPADHITLALIPHDRMMPTFAGALAAGKVPDLLSLDLILTPDFMKAGYLKDITNRMAGNANIKKVVKAHIDLATYKKRLYGVPFTPDDSVLLYNKALFKQAGLDAEKPPMTSGEIVAAARKIRALGPDVYGFISRAPAPAATSSPLHRRCGPRAAQSFCPPVATRSRCKAHPSSRCCRTIAPCGRKA